MPLRSLEFWSSSEFQKFIKDVNGIERLDLLIIKCTAMVQDMVVGLAAHRTGKDEETLERAPISKVARLALAKKEEQAVLDLVLEVAMVRTRPAHRLETDEFVSSFVEIWSKVKGGYDWPKDPIAQRDYCQTFFILLMFEIHRCGYDLPPSGQLEGKTHIDWDRHRQIYIEERGESGKGT